MKSVVPGAAPQRWAVLGATLLGLLIPAANAASAQAAPSPWWHLTQSNIPSHLEPGAEGTIVVAALNLGNAPVSGETTISDTLPPGLVLEGVEFFAPNTVFPVNRPLPLCQTTPSSASCSITQQFIEEGKTNDAEGNPRPLLPYQQLTMRLQVKDEGAAPPALNELSASGGATVPATLERPIPLGAGPIPFGLDDFRLTPEEEGGATATRAGSHPFQLTTDVAFNRSSPELLKVPALPRNLHFRLPPGQLGNALAAPQCSEADFAHIEPGPFFQPNFCLPDTAIGATVVTIAAISGAEESTFIAPVFNLVPAPGEPARFGFVVSANPVILDTAVRSGPGEDYGVTVTASNITQLVSFLSATTVFWGAPAAASHDESRGWGCLKTAADAPEIGLPCEPSNNPKPPAFLTLPTDCAHPFNPLFEGVSWPTKAAPAGFQAEPLEYNLQDGAGNPLGLTACNQVPFDPRIEAEPTSDAATSPTGLKFDINVEDPGLTNAGGVAQSQIKKAVVTLPQGFTTNPSVAEGLHACTEAQYESETFESPPGAGCPNESNIGKVEIESPLVKQKVIGALYVATQHDNPNHNLLTLYLVAKNPEIGILIKQALKVKPDPVTGQLTTEVDNVPELPFSHFQLSFRQGQRSPLVTPPACGTYTVTADLYPWSNPSAPVHRESSFQITQGPEGNPCPNGTPPFHPDLLAGSENPTAGAYSPFYTEITRRDSEQEITHFSIKLPPGVSGKLAGVPYCPEAGIAAAKAREHEGGGSEEEASPSCPAASLVGHSDVGSGVGNVLAYAPGKLYLAGPYHGSNLSIVSITAAKVGPFDLGTVVVRFALRINPETAEVFVDATGSDPIPHIVDGIPVHLRDIQAFVDRPNFTLNPTSCKKTSTASTVLGSGLNFASEADDQPVTVTSPFQVGSCASLGFKPKLALKLIGGTKRGAHPAFKAVLNARPGDANIGFSQVTLPHSEFLENAHIGTVCTRVQFKEGAVPGEKCPAASVYGRARAITPILSEPLQGPVYLRSSEHKLPDLVAALHNSQVDIALDGRIDSVGGRIRNTFEAVPDAPVTKFTLEMQGGKKGLLVNSTDLCASKHHAIAAFTGHNGKVDDFRPVLEAKCPKHKRHGKKHRRAHR